MILFLISTPLPILTFLPMYVTILLLVDSILFDDSYMHIYYIILIAKAPYLFTKLFLTQLIESEEFL